MYEVKKGVPIPHITKFPFEKMEVGDCFDVDNTRQNVHQAAKRYEKHHRNGFKIVCRTIKIDGKNIRRIWRVS